jgi:hypothetical protein
MTAFGTRLPERVSGLPDRQADHAKCGPAEFIAKNRPTSVWRNSERRSVKGAMLYDCGKAGQRLQQQRRIFMNIEANEALSFDAGDGDARHEIASLELRLDEIADALARCRKVKLASQIAMAGGGSWLLAAIIGFIGFDPAAMLTAIAGVIGGTVMYGSNTTTAQELEAEMNDAEAKRAALIGALDLRVVGTHQI